MLSFSFGRGKVARPLEIPKDNMTFASKQHGTMYRKAFFKFSVHFSLTPVSQFSGFLTLSEQAVSFNASVDFALSALLP